MGEICLHTGVLVSMPEYIWVILFVVAVFIPVTLNAVRCRRQPPPPMAANDRKLYRLWRSDPEAYERQYGEMDRTWLEAQRCKQNKEV